MAKVIKIENGEISLGFTDGSIKTVPQFSVNFPVKVGDIVDVFGEGKDVIISPSKAPLASNQKEVSKTVYCILAFFLGGLGIHKFYAGRIGLGILYLLFCWTGIPAVVALVEFIIALTKTSDHNGNIVV